MPLNKAKSPFRFSTQVSLTQITNWKAKSLGGLAACLKEVPDASIYHHTHRFLEQHQSLSPEPPNDFAYWVNTAFQDDRLAEKLASIDTVNFTTVRDLRAKIIETLETHLAKYQDTREAMPGNEFYFLRSISYVLSTPYEAWTLSEFVDALKKISIRSLYFHVFEARMRPPLGINDFSDWLNRSLGESHLSRAIAALDPYTQTLEGLRRQIVGLVEKRIQKIEREGGHVVA